MSLRENTLENKAAKLPCQSPVTASTRNLTRPDRERWPRPSYRCAIFLNSIFKSVMRIRISFTSDNW